MTGESPLTPPIFEKMAQSHAILILHNEMRIEDVRDIPSGMRARVEYLTRTMGK